MAAAHRPTVAAAASAPPRELQPEGQRHTPQLRPAGPPFPPASEAAPSPDGSPSNRLQLFWQRHVLRRAPTQRARMARVPVSGERSPAQASLPASWGCWEAPSLGHHHHHVRGSRCSTAASPPRGREAGGAAVAAAGPALPLPSPCAATPTLQELYRKSPGRADCQLT